MKSTFTYKIEDFDKFYKEFVDLVDISVDLSDYRLNPSNTRSDYFGKFQEGKFVIYHQHRRFLHRRIVLKIVGKISKNSLTLFISYYYQWLIYVNALFLTLFSLFLMIDLNCYIGLALLFINVLQAYLTFDYYADRKKDFIKIIEAMLIKK